MTVTTIDDPSDLSGLYADAPNGVRANMIFSADGAAAFRGRAGTLSCPADQNLLRDLRAFADVVLVGAGTARAERYGPARLTEAQQALRGADRGLAPPPIAVVSRTGRLPPTLFVDASSTPILVTSASAVRAHSLDSDPRWRLLVAGERDGRCRRGDKAAPCPRHATDPVRGWPYSSRSTRRRGCRRRNLRHHRATARRQSTRRRSHTESTIRPGFLGTPPCAAV